MLIKPDYCSRCGVSMDDNDHHTLRFVRGLFPAKGPQFTDDVAGTPKCFALEYRIEGCPLDPSGFLVTVFEEGTIDERSE